MAPPESIFGARGRGRSWRGADRDHSLSCSGESVRLKRPKRSKSLPRYPNDCQRGKKSAKSFALMSRQNLDGQKGSLRVEPSSTSDKRDDVLPARYVLAVSRLSSCVLALWPRLLRRRPEVWCFASCQNCPIERTPERTLLIR
jgi:hypothetical protein